MDKSLLSRRHFLAGSVAAGVAGVAGGGLAATAVAQGAPERSETITRNRPTVLRGGLIIPVAGDPFVGDIFIKDGLLADIGPKIEASGALQFDASQMIVIPGFIDTHRHLWQTGMRNLGFDMSLPEYLEKLYKKYSYDFLPEDIYASTYLGRLAALDAGVTTVLDWAHNVNRPADSEAGIDALTDAKGRSLFGIGYGADMQIDLKKHHGAARTEKYLRVVADRLARPESGALLSAMLLGREPGYFATLDAYESEVRLARSLGLRISVHLNNMGPDWKYFPSLKLIHSRGLAGEDTCYIHLTAAKDDELKIIADTGGHASIAAQIDAHMGGFANPPTGRLLAAGVRPSISADTAVASSEDMFSLMRSMFDLERAIIKGKLEPRAAGQTITTKDVLEFATLRGANALGLGKVAGSIEKGKQADLVLISRNSPNLVPLNDPVSAVVFGAHVGNIDTVLVGGEAVKQGGQLLLDWRKAKTMMEKTVQRLYSKRADIRN